MKHKFLLFLLVVLMCVCLVGCENENDHIEIYNKDIFTFDNINIEIKDGYFYDRHEKSTVDEKTICVTVYFTNNEDDEWK